MEYKFKLRQYINLSGLTMIFKNVLKRTRPTFKVNICDLDKNFLLVNKIKIVFIDKDNTLTLPYENEYASDKIKSIIQNMQIQLGFENVILISNSIGSENVKMENKKLIKNENLDILILNHGLKKPNIDILKELRNTELNIEKELENKNLSLENIFVIGDRLFTDIYLAEKNGFKSILVNPIDSKIDNFMVQLVRKIEKIILRI